MTDDVNRTEVNGADDSFAEAPASFDPGTRWRPRRHHRIGARLTGAAVATVAVAAGALAIGALAIGSLAIGRLLIGRVRVRDLEIDNLIVRKVEGLG
jgi:hypothetical protein